MCLGNTRRRRLPLDGRKRKWWLWPGRRGQARGGQGLAGREGTADGQRTSSAEREVAIVDVVAGAAVDDTEGRDACGAPEVRMLLEGRAVGTVLRLAPMATRPLSCSRSSSTYPRGWARLVWGGEADTFPFFWRAVVTAERPCAVPPPPTVKAPRDTGQPYWPRAWLSQARTHQPLGKPPSSQVAHP